MPAASGLAARTARRESAIDLRDGKPAGRRATRIPAARLLRAGALVASLAAAGPLPAAGGCAGTLYLTLDTGNMSQAQNIARILAKHDVKATFFLANERTPRGDRALDASWADYWRARAGEGHAFGTHTWHHGRFRGDLPRGAVRYVHGGVAHALTPAQVCEELTRVDARFRELTGRGLDPIWRAPGGRASANALAAARACGYRHVHWATAGFLGDELPSDEHPNDALLARALANLRDGDVLMMHLGIWSRKIPFAPMLDPLIDGLRARGFCFATLGPAR